ncbi:MAG: PadR family transcriptional regulator [Actinomycetota bacterium]
MRQESGIRILSDFFRGAVGLHILHHAAERGGVHGAWIAQELRRHGYRLSPGSLYPTLHRLESEGLLVSHKEVQAGRSRRVYRATKAGRAALKGANKALRELAEELLG